MTPAGTTACTGCTSPCAAAAPVAVAAHDLGFHCHSCPPGRPAFSSSTCACPGFLPCPAHAATCLSSPAAAASASAFPVDAAADHSREAACRLSFAQAVRGNPSSFEPSSDHVSAARSPCTPAAASAGPCAVAAGTAYHRATQCGVFSSCFTHFAAAAHRGIQQLACCELATSRGPSLTAAVGAWEAPDPRISNTRAGEGLRLAGDGHLHRRRRKKPRRKRLLSRENETAGVERASQPTLKSQQRARQQLQSLHAQRCTPRHCFSTKSYGDAAAAAVLLCLCCAVGIAAAQQTPCPSGWSTAVLSEARSYLAAASLPNQGLAIFAGGFGSFVTCC